jgi:hypothetical protein
MWCDHEKRIINSFVVFQYEEARESVIRSVFQSGTGKPAGKRSANRSPGYNRPAVQPPQLL